jgi:hypothetical protein
VAFSGQSAVTRQTLLVPETTEIKVMNLTSHELEVDTFFALAWLRIEFHGFPIVFGAEDEHEAEKRGRK